MSKFRIEVFVHDNPTEHVSPKVWKPMRPSGGEPYEWDTRAEAERQRDMSYPPASGLTEDYVRIIEVES